MVPKSEYRKTLGNFVTGVTIITSAFNGDCYGFTANSFSSVSLEPPLVLFCIKKEASFVNVLEKSKVFGINILTKDQEDLSNKFANPSLINSQRFEGTQYDLSDLGCPVFSENMVFLDCKVTEMTMAGDHFIVIGSVEEYTRNEGVKPLIYFQGGYTSL